MRAFARLVRALVAAIGFLILFGGLPVALVIFIGWPLPDHWPTTREWLAWATSDTLITTHTLIDGAACVLWIGWAWFAGYLGLETLRGLREVRLPHLTVPVRRQGLVGGMVGAIVLGVSRAAAAAHTGGDAHPATPTPAAATQTTATDDDSGQHTYTVRPGDTLWDIAARETGNPLRYKKIAAANQGRREPDGRRFADPDLIYPDWTLAIPDATPTPAPRRQPSPHRSDPNESAAPQAATPDSPAPTPRAGPATDPTPSVQGTAGGTGLFDAGRGGLVTAALAACLAAAVAAARLRRRRTNSSTDQEPDPGPWPPLVQATAAARDAAHRAGLRWDGPGGALLTVRVPFAVAASGRDLGVEAVAAGGLGLTGDGASGATRAVLAAALTTGGPARYRGQAEIITTTHLLSDLLGSTGSGLPLARLSDRLILTDTLAEACARMEEELLFRVGQLGDDTDQASDSHPDDPDDVPAAMIPIILLAHPTSPAVTGRLRALLTHGARYRLYGLLLDTDDWPITCAITADGRTQLHSSTNGPAPTRPGTPPATAPSLTIAQTRLSNAHAPVLTPHGLRDALTLLSDTVPGSGANERPSARSQHVQPVFEQPHPDRPEPPTAASSDTAASSSDAPSTRVSKPADTRQSATPAQPEISSDQAMDQPDRVSPSDRAPTTENTEPDTEASSAATLHVQVLGEQVTLSHADTPLTDGLRAKADDLLAWLAVHRAGGTAGAICADLWPHQPDKAAATSLYQVVANIRRRVRTLTRTPIILTARRTYRLAPTVQVDLWQLYDLLDHLPATFDQEALDRIDHATGLYRGDLLASGDEGDWAAPTRVALRQQLCRALRRAADAHLPDHPDKAATLLEHLLAIDPHNDSAWQRLLRLHATAGHPDELRHTLHLMTTRYQHAGLDPDPDTLHLAHTLLNQDNS